MGLVLHVFDCSITVDDSFMNTALLNNATLPVVENEQSFHQMLGT